MRASSLSSAKVVDLLNHYFVPVNARNADYSLSDADFAKRDFSKGGPAPAEEKAAYYRIHRDTAAAKLTTGSVQVWMLAPDGQPLDSLHVAQACKPDLLLERMERAIEKLKTPRGEPVVRPNPQSAAPPVPPDGLALHLTARNLAPRNQSEARDDLTGDYVPFKTSLLGTERACNWSNLPSEDWVVLGRDEWARLLPPGEVRVGTSWPWDERVAGKLLTHFYPPTENTDVEKNRIESQSLGATVLSLGDGTARARIDGRLRMKHPFYHKDDDNFTEASVVGYMDFEPGTRPRVLRLVTDKATYGSDKTKEYNDQAQRFGVAVRSVP